MKSVNFVFAVFMAFSSIQVNAQSETNCKEHVIEVKGYSEREVTPNEIHIKVEIDEDDFKGKMQLEELENQMLTTLKATGVDVDENVSVVDLVSNLRRYMVRKDVPFTKKEYRIIGHDGKSVMAIYKALESLKLSDIYITKITHSELNEILQELRVEAIIDAKSKATEMLNAIDLNLGKAVLITEIITEDMKKRFSGEEFEMKLAEDDAVNYLVFADLEFRDLKLSKQVVAKFLIE